MTDEDVARRALARLARTNRDANTTAESSTSTTSASENDQSYRETIERAASAVDDIDDAAQFVDDVGVEELEAAVERAEESVSACADDGQRVLETYRAFQAVARGEYFCSGRGNSLGGADIARSK